MFNGTYRSVHINDVPVEELRKRVSSDVLVVAVDVAKRKMKAGLGGLDGTMHRVVKWTHPLETDDFVEWVNGLCATRVHLVMEPTGTYQEPLRYRGYEEGWEVFYQSPNRVSDASQVYDGVDSQHDAKAAHVLLWLHGQGMSEGWARESDERRRLKVLVDRMANLEADLQRSEGRLESKLAAYWPEVASEWNITAATLLGVLQEFGGPGEVAKRPKQARRRMKKIGGYFLEEKRIEQVLGWAKETVGKPMLEQEREVLARLAAQTDRIRREQRKLGRRVSGLLARESAFEDVRRVGKEVGESTGAVFRVKVGDFREYEAPEALLKGFGLNLKENSSGEQEGKLMITKRGPSEARRYLYLATLRKIQGDPVFGAWHTRKVARDGGTKLKSVVALMRKYVSGLWHVARGRAFDSTKLFDVSRLDVA